MSLRSALNLVLEEYSSQSQYSITGNELASFIRSDIPKLIAQIVGGDERYTSVAAQAKGIGPAVLGSQYSIDL